MYALCFLYTYAIPICSWIPPKNGMDIHKKILQVHQHQPQEETSIHGCNSSAKQKQTNMSNPPKKHLEIDTNLLNRNGNRFRVRRTILRSLPQSPPLYPPIVRIVFRVIRERDPVHFPLFCELALVPVEHAQPFCVIRFHFRISRLLVGTGRKRDQLNDA